MHHMMHKCIICITWCAYTLMHHVMHIHLCITWCISVYASCDAYQFISFLVMYIMWCVWNVLTLCCSIVLCISAFRYSDVKVYQCVTAWFIILKCSVDKTDHLGSQMKVTQRSRKCEQRSHQDANGDHRSLSLTGAEVTRPHKAAKWDRKVPVSDHLGSQMICG